MNFDDAIKAHAEWKMRLASYLRNPDRSLDPNSVCKDNQCALGKWIYGEGSVHRHLPEYAALKRGHAEFHRAAADIIRRADRGEKVQEEVMLGSKSGYAQLSSSVIQAIMSMRQKAQR
jgi:methyl-accepting chemotaxis protein